MFVLFGVPPESALLPSFGVSVIWDIPHALWFFIHERLWDRIKWGRIK